MLGTLIESAAVRQRRRGGTVVSLALHTVVIAGLVAGSVRDSEATRAPEKRIEKVTYFKTREEPPRTANPRTVSAPRSASAPQHPLVVVPPMPVRGVNFAVVPPTLPPVDATLLDQSRGDDLRDLVSTGNPLAAAPGGTGRGSLGTPGGVLDARGVDRVAALVRPVPEPRYPELLRGAQVEGRVVVRAVVDTLGRLEEGSLTVLHADHDAFAASVRQVATRLRFTPALAEGRRVRMLIELPFEFRLHNR